MIVEIWKPIEGFPGYSVSSIGRIASFRRPGRTSEFDDDYHILTPRKIGNSLRVNLCRDGRVFEKKLHRLVAEAFIGPQPSAERFQVAHKDGNYRNNYVDNLYWATPSENTRDSMRHGTHVMTRCCEHCSLRKIDG